MWPSLWSFKMGMKNLRDFCEENYSLSVHQHSSFTPFNPYNHCDNHHVAHNVRGKGIASALCRVHWLEGVENSWLKHSIMSQILLKSYPLNLMAYLLKVLQISLIHVKSLRPNFLNWLWKGFCRSWNPYG